MRLRKENQLHLDKPLKVQELVNYHGGEHTTAVPSVSATNPRCVSLTIHRHKSKVTTLSKTRPSRRDSSLRNLRVDQEDKVKLKEQDTTKEKPPLSGRQASRGRGCPEYKSQYHPNKLVGNIEGGLPHQSSTAPPHSNPSHRSVRYRAPK